MEGTRHPHIVGPMATLVIIPLLPILHPKDGQDHPDTAVHPLMVVHLHLVQILDHLVHLATHIIMVLDLDTRHLLDHLVVHPRRHPLQRPQLRVVQLHLQVEDHRHPLVVHLLGSLHHQIKTLMDLLDHITISIR